MIGAAAVALGAAYVLYVRSQRFKRINQIHESYAQRHDLLVPPALQRDHPDEFPTRAKYPMKPAEAQQIILNGSLLYDAPWLIIKSYGFALFKTYGIPTIASLLAATAQLKDKDKAGRRYADTSTLITAFMTYPIHGPGSGATEEQHVDPRNAVAVARMNYLHSKYKGKISNDDFLYTMSTFIVEPAAWSAKYGWRPLTPVEEQAYFVFWSEIGRRMGIQHIPDELEGLYEWAEEYEKEHMVPKKANHEVALETVELLLFNVPGFVKPFARKVVSALVYPRLRNALMLPDPPAWIEQLTATLLGVQAFFLRNLMLPRSKPFLYLPSEEEAPSRIDSHAHLSPSSFTKNAKGETVYAPRMNVKHWDNEPWYGAPSTGLARAWERVALTLGLLGPRQVPGPLFKPEGFRLEEVGPQRFEQEGHDRVREMAQEMLGGKELEGPFAVGGMKCPFSGAK